MTDMENDKVTFDNLPEMVNELGAPDKPCGVGRADANPKTMLPNDT